MFAGPEVSERDEAELRDSLGDRQLRPEAVGGNGQLRARHLAGVRAGGEGGEVHRAGYHLQRPAGDLVPRAGAQHRGEDDDNLQL